MIHVYPSKKYCERSLLQVLLLFLCFPAVALGTDEITGSVRNQSRGMASGDDEVILIRPDHGMQELEHAKTSASGEFTLHVQDASKSYLVRVIHQDVAYEQMASAGDALAIQVFDVAPRVNGISGTIEILRAGTNGKLLHVSDMYEIKNESNPPFTQASKNTFEVCLSPNAKMDSVLAAGPDSIGILISATPVPGKPGHYAVGFPLRPGATKFAFNYDVPYESRAAFHTWHLYSEQQLAIMIAPTMKFSSHSTDFRALPAGDSKYQVEAVGQLTAGEGPEFEISGAGALPALGGLPKSPAGSQEAVAHKAPAAAPSQAPLVFSSNVGAQLTQSKPQSPTLVLYGVIIILLGVCVLLVWRTGKQRKLSAAKKGMRKANHAQRAMARLQALNKELARLEADRMRGTISKEEYSSTKQALEKTLHHSVVSSTN